MTVKEKLNFFHSHGISITYIAKQMNIETSTLSKWLRGEKGITHKNEELLNLTLQNLAKEFSHIME